MTALNPTPTKYLTCVGGCGHSEQVPLSSESLVCADCLTKGAGAPTAQPAYAGHDHAHSEVNLSLLDASDVRSSHDAPACLSPEEAEQWSGGYNAALAYLGDLFVLTWSGGLPGEDVSHFATRDAEEARTKFDEWGSDCAENSRVDMVRIALDGKVTIVDVFFHGMDEDGED